MTHIGGVPVEDFGSLSFRPISEDEWFNSLLSPTCLVDRYLYADVGVIVAAGGTGKTSLILYEAIHIVLGWPLYGREIKTPGPVVILSAEDDRGLMTARLRETAKALGCNEGEIRRVRAGVLIEYVGGQDFRLRPLTTALMVATRSDPAVEAVPEVASDEERAVAFAKALARRAALALEGVGDADGNPVEPSPDAIDALLDVWPIFESFQLTYGSKGLLLEQEKKPPRSRRMVLWRGRSILRSLRASVRRLPGPREPAADP